MQKNIKKKEGTENTEPFNLRSNRRIFGRKAVKLSQTQKDLLETLFPEVKLPLKPGLINLDDYFNVNGPCHLEIGFGDGEYTRELAKTCRDHRIIGCEIFKNGIASLLKSMREEDLKNIRIIEGNALSAVQDMFSAETFDFIHINHPDPWPKKRHHKRRLIQPHTVDLLQKILKQGGEIWLSTDKSDYAEWMEACFKGWENLEKYPAAGRFLDNLTGRRLATKYEEKGVRQGRKTRYLKYKKIN